MREHRTRLAQSSAPVASQASWLACLIPMLKRRRLVPRPRVRGRETAQEEFPAPFEADEPGSLTPVFRFLAIQATAQGRDPEVESTSLAFRIVSLTKRLASQTFGFDSH